MANLTKPDNSLFPIEFWQNCLVSINAGTNPHLVWGAHPTMSPVSGYKLYRAVMDQQANPNTGNYQLIYTSPNNQVFDYTDNDVNLGSHDNYVYYYVKAFNSSSSSGRSNYVGTEGEFLPYKSRSNQRYKIDIISLNNYPNPFNPTTTIEYSVTVETFIRLEVFNLLGKQIATLVDKKQQPGTYEEKFDSTNLPSGLYIYKLTANENIVTKKMMLLR